jgi:phosphate transport system permease protein
VPGASGPAPAPFFLNPANGVAMAEPSQTKAAMSRREKTPRSRLLADRVAKWVVSAGGLAIIVSILGILFFILAEVWPLTTRPRVERGPEYALPGAPLGAVLADEHRSHAAALAADGELRILRLRDRRVVAARNVAPEAPPAAGTAPLLTRMKVRPEGKLLAAATRDGRVLIVPLSFAVTFEGDDRQVTPAIGETVVLTLDPAGRPLGDFSAQIDEEGNATAAAELADGTIAIVERSIEENMLTGETSESVDRHVTQSPYDVTAIVLSEDRQNLFAGTAGGELLWWPLGVAETGEVGEPRPASAGPSPVTALTLLIGSRSLVVGQGNGALSVWFPVREGEEESFRLTRIRDFPPHPGAIRALAASPRDKGFLAVDGQGTLGLYHSTSHRTLWRGRAPLAEAAASLTYAPKADGVYLAAGNRLAALDIFNPHPEVNLKTLFGRVWYEGYDRPEYVWQSSSGSDDFEPKLSLTPLLVGTLKGTFYSLLLAIPLGILGAMYTSQFMHPTYKRYLKPMIEIMASLPSVVLGFLAGLWLAPRIEDAVPALALMVVVLPLFVLAGGYAWRALPRSFRGRFPFGIEALLFVFVLAFGIWVCFQLSPAFERLAFGGNFQSWLLQATGLGYDQRNAVVVGLAMGFAVIPIIFAIAEDAFSNVPRNLVAGSLALGADRWQTVTRVVLPTASPGIFSAVMIGFGRAVGETMIVLMATGNTPIMEWNPFNGFRTLSANIAVEIPEAPHGGTLYRALFLAALLLFVITFLINTAAEVVRQRLRERYSQL